MINVSSPFISIVTPVYNRADCIERCISSVLRQTFTNYELIVINDGSNDRTKETVENCLLRTEKINFITYDVNKGVNYARNRGIEATKGSFILFLDSDDQLSENALSIVFDGIEQNSGFEHFLFGVSDRSEDASLPKVKTNFQFSDWLIGKVQGDFAHVITPSCFLGLLFIEEFRLYESLNWLRVLRRNKYQLYLPGVVLVRERDRTDSLTKEAILDNKQAITNSYNYLLQFIKWYGADFIAAGQSTQLIQHFKKAYFLGLAIGKVTDNNELMSKMNELGFQVAGLKLLNREWLRPLFFRMVTAKSKLNQLVNSY